MEIVGIIPARYASSRFPGKPLAKIKGKPMIQWVVENAKKAKHLDKLIVATDDKRIYETVLDFGGKAVYTSTKHRNGTERCFEAFKKEAPDADVVINIQGDEPLIDPNAIDLVAKSFQEKEVEIATLANIFKNTQNLFDQNKPKVICNQSGFALYFSRQAIPYNRNEKEENWLNSYPYLHHIGLYAYRTDILEKIIQLPVSELEKTESLEQLRWLDNGIKIKVIQVDYESIAVDTPEDITFVERHLKG